MRQGWEYKKIKEICTFIGDGDWIESKDQSPSGIRLIQTGNVGNGIFKDKGNNAKYISEKTFKELSCTEIYEGDCLLSRLPEPIGRGCILPKLGERTITAVDCTILRFNTDVIPQYFVYYTQSIPYSTRIDTKTTGSTRKRISRKNLENIDIPLPPKSTQQAIVSELDKINELIRLKKEQLKDYDNLAQSIFYEMFGDPVTNEKGWEVKKLGDVCGFLNGDRGVNYPSSSDFVQSGIPFINAGHLNCGKVDFKEMNYITIEKYNSLHAGKIQQNDILFCLRGSLGKYAIVNFETEGAIASSLVIIRSSMSVNSCFIANYLQTNAIKSQITRSNNGSSQPNLSAKSVSAFSIPLPPIPLQQTFATRIEAIERQKAKVQKAITELETLLASRMQYWFE